MGIRCLLGHDFGGREVERDRREDGDEVVVAYRTVETCERCGSRRVISENKEIKPLGATAEAPEPASPAAPEPTPEVDAPSPEPPGGMGTGDDSPSETAAERETAAASAGNTTDAAEDAAIIIDDAPAAPADDPSTPDLDAVAESESTTGLLDDETDAPDDGEMTVVDDGQTELLDDETDAPDDADDAAWPDADDGVDAASPTEGGPTDADGAPAPWPETEGVERDSNGTKFVRPETETPDRDETTEFHCQSCGTTRSSSASSLRSGDVCPECRKGYLAERRVER